MIWQNPYWLLGVLAAAVLATCEWLFLNEKESRLWPVIRRVWTDANGVLPSKETGRKRFIFLWFGLAFTFLALARPQWGEIEEPVFEQAREILIAMDLSQSMMAEDVRPNRLERAKLLCENLLTELKGERVGLVLFSGTAFLQSPLSSDYGVLSELLPMLNPAYLPEGGTDYGAMIETSLESFSNDGGADRFLIVLSDGESLDERWEQMTSKLAGRKIRVIGLGVGTEDGGLIPDEKGGFVKNDEGGAVLSKLGKSTLQQLAASTGGIYCDASGWVEIDELIAETVNRGQEGSFSEKQHRRKVERFQFFLAVSLALFLAGFWFEFPCRPRPRSYAPKPPKIPLSPLAAGFLLVLLSESNAQHQEPPAHPLPKTVAELSEKKTVSAQEWEKMVRQTLSLGTAVMDKLPPEQSIPPQIKNLIEDGLAAADAGERMNPSQAQWENLREELKKLLQEKQPPQQQQDKNKDQKSQDKNDQSQNSDSQSSKQNDKSNDAQQQQKSDQSNKQEGSPQDKSSSNEKNQPQQENKNGTGEQQNTDQPPARPPQSPESSLDQSMTNSPPAKAEPSSGTQKIGSQQQMQPVETSDPQVLESIKKLDQVRDKDSPARLFQLLENRASTNSPHARAKGKNW